MESLDKALNSQTEYIYLRSPYAKQNYTKVLINYKAQSKMRT
jgi:hypothetical protein